MGSILFSDLINVAAKGFYVRKTGGAPKLSQPQAHSAAQRIRSIEKSSDLIGRGKSIQLYKMRMKQENKFNLKKIKLITTVSFSVKAD
jgi:hypothetical protein